MTSYAQQERAAICDSFLRLVVEPGNEGVVTEPLGPVRYVPDRASA